MAKKKRWLGWHFLDEKKLAYRENCPLKVGKTYRQTGEPTLCYNGLHACPDALDAFSYVSGRYACRVELSGRMRSDSHKTCATARTVLGWCDLDKLKKGKEPKEVATARKKLAYLAGRFSALKLIKGCTGEELEDVSDSVETIREDIRDLHVALSNAADVCDFNLSAFAQTHQRKGETGNQAAHRILMAEIKRQGHYVKGRLA